MFKNNDKGLLKIIKKLENRISYLERKLCIPKNEKRVIPYICQFHMSIEGYTTSKEIEKILNCKCDECR